MEWPAQVQLQLEKVEDDDDDSGVSKVIQGFGSLLWSVWMMFEVKNWKMHEWIERWRFKAQFASLWNLGYDSKFWLFL